MIASSSASTREFELEYSRVRAREFECEYSRVREWVRVLASSRASVHTRNLTHVCALLSLACLTLARLQYSRVALRVTRVTRTRLLTCGWAALYKCSLSCADDIATTRVCRICNVAPRDPSTCLALLVSMSGAKGFQVCWKSLLITKTGILHVFATCTKLK